MIRKAEMISFWTHASTAVFAIAGGFILLFAGSPSVKLMITALVYGASVSWLFIASSVYHASKKSESDTTIWRKLDHIAIFFMIAGTYTAICGAYLPPVWFYSIVGAQWGIVLFGIFFKFFYLNAPRVVYTIIYLAMGWMALVPIKILYTAMGIGQFMLLFGGGLAFSVGAIFYALKKPVIVKNRFGFHEIFHIMIVIGASLHYALVFRAFGVMRAAL